MILSYTYRTALLLSIAFLFYLSANAQESNPLKEGTVEQQLDHVINKSNRYQQYKVIQSTWMNTLRNNVTDTLSQLKGTVQNQQKELSVRNNTIDSLRAELNETNNRLETAIEEKNSLTFLGIAMEKSVYNTILFTIIILLAAGSVTAVFLYKKK